LIMNSRIVQRPRIRGLARIARGSLVYLVWEVPHCKFGRSPVARTGGASRNPSREPVLQINVLNEIRVPPHTNSCALSQSREA